MLTAWRRDRGISSPLVVASDPFFIPLCMLHNFLQFLDRDFAAITVDNSVSHDNSKMILPQRRHSFINLSYISYIQQIYFQRTALCAGLSGHVVLGVGLRPLAYWDYGFESRLGHGCLSVVSVVCCQG